MSRALGVLLCDWEKDTIKVEDVAVPLDFTKLIPELGYGTEDVHSWRACVGKLSHAIAYGELFWPEFQMIDGCVLFAGVEEASYRKWLHALKGNRTLAQAVLNHRHILELFPNDKRRPTREQVVYLGRKLKTMWARKLTLDFPRQRTTVFFSDGKNARENLLTYVITFFTGRAAELTKAKRRAVPKIYLAACHPCAHL